MPEYALIDPVTGQQWNSTEIYLTRELQHNYILFRDGEHIGIITHRDLVLFVRWCAGKILARLKGEPGQSVVHALRLVDKWLEDERSVTSEELETARKAVWVAWNANATAVGVAARAVETIMHSAWAVAWAAENACAVRISYETQAQWLVEHLRSGK